MFNNKYPQIIGNWVISNHIPEKLKPIKWKFQKELGPILRCGGKRTLLLFQQPSNIKVQNLLIILFY